MQVLKYMTCIKYFHAFKPIAKYTVKCPITLLPYIVITPYNEGKPK